MTHKRFGGFREPCSPGLLAPLLVPTVLFLLELTTWADFPPAYTGRNPSVRLSHMPLQ
jgi:hypothetical protein